MFTKNKDNLAELFFGGDKTSKEFFVNTLQNRALKKCGFCVFINMYLVSVN